MAPSTQSRLVVLSAFLVALPFLALSETATPAIVRNQVAANLRLPLSFERNVGQVADASAAWVGRANGYGLALSATGATIVPASPDRSDVIRMQFLNARPAAAAKPLEPLPGKTNYLVGRDPKRWIQNLATYSRIEYQNVYDGIDVAWYGNQGQLEYDFRVQPGADPNRIRVRFEGARKLALDSSGDVRIETAAGSLSLRLPEVYQEIAGARKRVQGHYVLRASNEVGFELAGYDRSKPLVIDPTLVYGTYFGNWLSVAAITTDTLGNVYIGGSAGGGLPLVDPLQPGMLGSSDVWVAKFNSTGTALLYSTYVGGSGSDSLLTPSSSLAVTAGGELIATGNTWSADFPLVNAAQSQGPTPQYNLPFAFKLNASGSAFVYSTYFGGAPTWGASGYSVATDAAGNAYIAGESSGSFATTPGAYQSSYGGGYSDAFVVKLGPSGALVYSTMVGGAQRDCAAAIAVDSAGNAYVAGYTGSSSFPNNPPGAVTANAGGLDTFVAKLNPDGSAVVWLTFLGGSGDDVPNAMVRDSASGKLYVAGYSTSTDLPTTAGVIQQGSNGPKQGFVASVNSDGMSFGFVTYLGGGKDDAIQGMALTPAGQLVVAGTTTSTGFPTANAIQPAFTGLAPSLYASANSGASWTAADDGLPGWVSAISPDPSHPGTLLAASGSSFAWYRTSNSGASWTRSGASSLALWWHAVGGQFVRSPSNPAVVYFCLPESVGEGTPPVHSSSWMAFGSNDGGATWRLLAVPPAASSDPLWGMAVSPTDENKILEVTLSGAVFRSTNGGASFTQAGSLPSGMAWISSGSVAGSPDGSVYVAAVVNVYKSTDFGTTWTPANGIPDWQGMGPLAVSASNPSVVYAGTAYLSPGKIYKTTDAGATWNEVTAPGVNLGCCSGASLVVAPSNPQVVYAAYGNQVVKSTNGGTTWSGPVALPGNIWGIAVSPSDPTAIWAADTAATNGFAAELSSNGRTLLWSTFYSGSAGASPTGVAAAPAGDVWIAGNTNSTDLPITANAYSSRPYGGAAFLARISDSTAACSYSINPSSIISYTAEFVSFAVTAPSGCGWTATPSDGSWIGVQSGAAGTGSGVVSVALTANTTGSTRTGSVSVNGQSFAIAQAASSCTYSLGAPANLPFTGGTAQITVTAPAGCPWSAMPGSPLVSVVSGGSGTGNGTVTLSLPANSSVQWFSPAVQVGPQSVTLQEADMCSYSLSPTTLGAAGHSGSFRVTANLAGCTWSPMRDEGWLTVSGNGTGSGTFPYSVLANTTGAVRTSHVTIDHQQFTVTQSPSARFVPMAPCRVVDTRNAAGPFGGPALAGNTSRNFAIPSGSCGIPSTALAYSFNVTVTPSASLLYLTMWPTGQVQPVVSTLNALDGRWTANAAIVPAGTSGSVSVFVSDTTHVILDINGYFVPSSTSGALAFYPLTPCRAMDTRGGTSIGAGGTITAPVRSSSCSVPSAAVAYSLNFTALPHGPLGWITTWPTGQGMPTASTLNAPTGTITANAAILPAGTNGSVDVYASDATDLLVDINGYFAPPGTGGLSFYTMTPCRVADTRNADGPFGGPALLHTRDFAVPASACGVQGGAQAYSLNATVWPGGFLNWLTLWPTGGSMPVVSTLNSWDGRLVANAAIVPTTTGSITAYASDLTTFLFDINGYFAP